MSLMLLAMMVCVSGLLHYVAVRCSVLQCAALCCSELHMLLQELITVLLVLLAMMVCASGVLQCAVVCYSVCDVLPCCGVLQCAVVCWSVMQCVASSCSVFHMSLLTLITVLLVLLAMMVCASGDGVRFRCVAVTTVLQCAAVCCSALQCTAVRCSVLQCAAVCYSALQCAAVCCSVLKCFALRCICCCRCVRHDSYVCDTTLVT